jgi:hypothetical protein
MKRKSDPEKNSEYIRRFFYGLSWAAVLLAFVYLVNGQAARTLSCGVGALCFFVMSHLQYHDLDR